MAVVFVVLEGDNEIYVHCYPLVDKKKQFCLHGAEMYEASLNVYKLDTTFKVFVPFNVSSLIC